MLGCMAVNHGTVRKLEHFNATLCIRNGTSQTINSLATDRCTVMKLLVIALNKSRSYEPCAITPHLLLLLMSDVD